MASGAGFRQMKNIAKNINEYAREGFGVELIKHLLWATKGSTVQLVSNCEDVSDWDIENTSHFNAVNETSDIRGDGSNSIELVDVSTTKGTTVALDEAHRPNNEDWTWANWLCMWIHDDTGARLSGELTFQIRNNGEWSAEVNVPTLAAADFWYLRCIDITGLARGHVDGFRFVNQRGTGSSEKVYIDEIFITDLVSGIGAGSALCTGPVFGPVIMLPVVTGSTIVPGDPVEWGVMGVATATADDERIIGIACQGTPTSNYVASDTVPVEVPVLFTSGIFYARNDATGMAVGEPALFGADVVTEAAGTATAAAEKAFCISLETSSGATIASGDSAFQLMNMGTED
jgi:hypothetical protein